MQKLKISMVSILMVLLTQVVVSHDNKKHKVSTKPLKVIAQKKYVILAAAHSDYQVEVARLLSLVRQDLLGRYEVSESDVEMHVVSLNAAQVCALYPNSFILKFGTDATFSNYACSRGKPVQTTLFAFVVKIPKNNRPKPKGYNDNVAFLVKQGADDIAQALEFRKKS